MSIGGVSGDRPRSRRVLAIAAAALCAPAALWLTPSPSAQPPCDLSGFWQTDFGPARFAHNLTTGVLSGAIATVGELGTLEGTVTGDAIALSWTAMLGGVASWGSGQWQIASDCATLSGEMVQQGGARRPFTAALTRQAAWLNMDSPAVFARKASDLDRAGDLLGEMAALLPDPLDRSLILAAAGSTPDAIASWVHESTALVAYGGALRGPDGVLSDRMGNSLDRALLLANLLVAGGFEVRLAHGTLDDPAMGRVVSMLGRAPVADARFPVSPPELPAPEAPTAVLLAEPDFAAFQATWETDAQRLANQHAALTETIAERLALDLDAVLVDPQVLASARDASLRDHWWVEVSVRAEWSALDPTFADLVPPILATEVLSLDAIGEGLEHRVEILVSIETWRAGALSTDVVLAVDFAARDVRGAPILFQNLPGAGVSSPTATADPVGAALEALTAETRWMPALQMPDGLVTQRLFTVTGLIEEPLPGATALPGELARGGTAAALTALTGGGSILASALCGLFGTCPPAPTEGKVVAQWLDIVIHRPGSAPARHRRAVFDLLSSNQREVSPIAEPVIDSSLAQSRALAFIGRRAILVQSSGIDPVIEARRWAQVHQHLFGGIAGSFAASIAGEPTDAVALAAAFEAANPLTLFPSYRTASDELLSASHVDRPNVFALHFSAIVEADGTILPRATFDIIENRMGSTGPVAEGALRALRQGVSDSVAEGFLVGDWNATSTAARAYLESATSWRLITPGMSAAVVDAARRPFVEADLDAGFAVLVAPDEVPYWWRYDMSTGTVLGMGAPGEGQAFWERVAITANNTWQIVNLGIRAAGGILCASIFVDNSHRVHYIGDFFEDVALYTACVAAHYAGFVGQYWKVGNMLKWFRGLIPSHYVDLMKDIPTFVGWGILLYNRYLR